MVYHETLPGCRACRDAHDEDSCPVIIQARESNNEFPNKLDTMNYVGEESDIICSVTGKAYNVSEDQMKQIKGKSVYSDVITRMYGEKPTQEQIRKWIRDKEWNTYQRINKAVPQRPEADRQIPQKAPVREQPMQTVGAARASQSFLP